jgi:hypothetical protein
MQLLHRAESNDKKFIYVEIFRLSSIVSEIKAIIFLYFFLLTVYDNNIMTIFNFEMF